MQVSDHGGLTSNNAVIVTVLNVNDVSISAYSGTVLHSTLGGDTVLVVGSNFGPVDHSISTTFSVSYGSGSGVTYTATNCFRAGEALTRCWKLKAVQSVIALFATVFVCAPLSNCHNAFLS